jgi:hypothetical protein
VRATSRGETAGPPLKGNRPTSHTLCEVAGCATGSTSPLIQAPIFVGGRLLGLYFRCIRLSVS